VRAAAHGCTSAGAFFVVKPSRTCRQKSFLSIRKTYDFEDGGDGPFQAIDSKIPNGGGPSDPTHESNALSSPFICVRHPFLDRSACLLVELLIPGQVLPRSGKTIRHVGIGH